VPTIPTGFPIADALVPGQLSAVPADPFDGKPLRFKRLTKGYVIYSIGKDGQVMVDGKTSGAGKLRPSNQFTRGR